MGEKTAQLALLPHDLGDEPLAHAEEPSPQPIAEIGQLEGRTQELRLSSPGDQGSVDRGQGVCVATKERSEIAQELLGELPGTLWFDGEVVGQL